VLLSRSNRTEALRKILVQRVCNNVNGMKVGSEFRALLQDTCSRRRRRGNGKCGFGYPHRMRRKRRFDWVNSK
jgi:hypothetical protein